MRTFTVSPPFQTAYTVRTDCDTVARLFELQYGQYIHPAFDTTYDFTATRQHEGYTVTQGEHVWQTDSAFDLIEAYMHGQKQFDERILALHGTAVEHEGRAFLFLAATGGGKTTLAAYLTSEGHGYLTDDCILIDRETLAVYPCTSPIHLREGGMKVLRYATDSPPETELMVSRADRRHVYTPSVVVSKPLPLGGIFFIARTEENRLIPMTTTERMMYLLKSPITVYPINKEHLTLIGRLAAVPCHKLYYSDMAFVKEVIHRGS